MARIDVHRADARPGLTIVSRQGDPVPAVSLAVVIDAGPAASSALGGLLASRLTAAGHEVGLAADGIGFRLDAPLEDDDAIGRFLSSLAEAITAPVTELPVDLAPRLDALRGGADDDPALGPVIACTGQLATGPAPTVPTAVELEAWRRSQLRVDRMALAVVGPAAIGSAAIAARDRIASWPAGDGTELADTWPHEDEHNAFLSVPLQATAGEVDLRAELHLAFWVAGPGRAAESAQRMGRGDGALSAKLGALESPWRPTDLHATARPKGGCIAVRLALDTALPRGRVAAAAARATRVVQSEVEQQLRIGADPHFVTREILTADDPRQVAARAAWWALSEPAHEAPTRSASTLAVGLPSRAEPALDVGAIETRYRADLAAAQQALPEQGAARRVRVERGQGQLWMLLASPCALAHEGAGETGTAALATLTAVAASAAPAGVQLEPWVTGDGVGLIAHGPLARPDEPPAVLARRVARALGRAFSNPRPGHLPFEQARHNLVGSLQTPEHGLFEAFALRAVPDHPAWIAPLGTAHQHLARRHDELTAAWRRVLRGPLRLAVLANADEAQAASAANEVDRWLLPEAGGAACAERATSARSRTGVHHVEGPAGRALLAVRLTEPGVGGASRADLGQLIAAMLDGAEGRLARAFAARSIQAATTTTVVGAQAVATLLVDIHADPAQLADARASVVATLTELGGSRPGDAELTEARRRVVAARRRERADPRRRLADLWLDEAVEPGAVDEAALSAWASAQLTADHLLTVTTELRSDP